MTVRKFFTMGGPPDTDHTIRTFETGATRSADAGRDDPEGFLSPLVIDRYNEYMTKHRKQADGNLRASDNWQNGMPRASYMKGAWRHFLHLWARHREWPVRDPGAAADIEEDCCALFFNVQGYLHELVRERLMGPRQGLTPPPCVDLASFAPEGQVGAPKAPGGA